ncbi:hypothetical protein [Brachybacterium sp. FME24]|uniref:hypothetical protein n=1 Tax=Brachybacterium sp. FME24 TaxID=2742605 RepID=UPI0018668102|nr:hypothetical protein [Brachybacterium sp. FME24]
MNGSLDAVREVWAQRSEARTRGDLLYLVYVVVLSALIFGIPALQTAGSALARPDVLPVLLMERAPQVSAAIACAGGAVLVLLGAVRGPALLSPFFTATLAASGIRRRAVLWRPFARALLVPVLGMVIPAVLVSVTLATVGHASTGGVVGFALAAAGAGLLLGAAWLAGQLLGAVARRTLVAVLAALALGALLLPIGVGIGGAYPIGVTLPVLSAGSLLLAGLLAVGVSVPLLDRLRGAVLQDQAARWEAATVAATTMDLAGAGGMFRAPPTAGRALRAIGSGPLVVLYARRDAIAWLRSPERMVLGVVGALLAAAALAGSTVLTGPLAWFVALVGSLALWAASGSFVDGIRHGVHTLGAPRLFGQSAGKQVLLHLVAPMLLLCVLGAFGGAATWITAAAGAASAADAVLLPLALAPVLILGRARDAAKGPMPLALSTPMPTPQGDTSVVAMLAWQSDALLLALAAGVLLLAVAPLGAAWLFAAAAALTALMTLMTWGRLRALRA